MCNQELETIYHVFVVCPFVVRCWQQLQVRVQTDSTEFEEWLAAAFKKLGKKGAGLVSMLCWSLWRARNDMVWKNRSSSVMGVVTSAKSYLDQWSRAQDSTRVIPLQNTERGDGAER